MRVTTARFESLVRQAVETLPEPFQGRLADVAIDVEPQPDSATLRALDLDDPGQLLGLYQGTPLTERTIEHDGRLPDRIVIYQRNVERICRTRHQIIEQVRRTVLHEIGHHFGLDEDALDALGYD